MFLGFLSKRTFTGFCSSYFRFCVRSYVRNVLVRDEKVNNLRGAYERVAAREEPDPVLASADGEMETPEELRLYLNNVINERARRDGWTADDAIRLSGSVARVALRKRAVERGLVPSAYQDRYKMRVTATRADT